MIERSTFNMANKNDRKYERLVHQMKETRTVASDGKVTFVEDSGSIYELDGTEGVARIYTGGRNNPTTLSKAVARDSANGYVAVNFHYLDLDGTVKQASDYLHTIMAMAYHLDEYEALKTEGATDIVVMHINGLRYDDRAENLEWGTQTENRMHGTITNKLDEFFPGLYTSTELRYDSRRNLVEYVWLHQGIKIAWIYEWFGEAVTNRKLRVWTPASLQAFVDFLIKKGYWRNVFN